MFQLLIDLSNVSPTRGSKQGTAGSVPQIIPSGSPLDLTLAFAARKRRAPVLDNVEVETTYRVVGVNTSTSAEWRHAFAGARGFQPRPCRTL